MTIFNKNIFTEGTVTYSDFDLGMKRNPVTNDVAKKTDVEAIRQSLKSILFTNFGERPFRPFLYGGLNDLLFEPLDAITTIELDSAIRIAINNYEPRIDIVELDIIDKSDENAISISIKFNMKNSLDIQDISIILNRLR